MSNNCTDTVPEDWVSLGEAMEWVKNHVKDVDFLVNNWDYKYTELRVDLRTGLVKIAPGNAKKI